MQPYCKLCLATMFSEHETVAMTRHQDGEPYGHFECNDKAACETRRSSPEPSAAAGDASKETT